MLPDKDDEAGWIEVFRKLGARDPEHWAQWQAGEGDTQSPLHAYLFLKMVTERIGPRDASWVEVMANDVKPYAERPWHGLSGALQRARAAGAADEDLAIIAEGAQLEALLTVLEALDDCTQDDEAQEVVGDQGWALVATDEDDEPTSVRFGNMLYEELMPFLEHDE